MIKLLFGTFKKQSFLNYQINYNFVFSKLLKKNKQEQNPEEKSNQQQKQEQKDKFNEVQVQDDEPQDSYDFFQRQKQIQTNIDFRKLKKLNQSSIIPQDIGKGGFNQLVYWSMQAKTPQKILQLIKKFNQTSFPKKIEDELNFNHFKANVQATVYLANTYPALSEYALFGYKYQILNNAYWLKIQQKILRKIPMNQQQINQLIDIAFVMGTLKAGQYIYNNVEKLLQNADLNIDQTTKLIISFFRAEKGDKEWLVKLLMNFTLKINQIDSQILESILPILKHSKNIPPIFEQKLQKRIKQMINQLTLPAICNISSYFGFEKGDQELWVSLEERTRYLLSQIKKERKKIPSKIMVKLIQGIMSSYKFSLQFIKQQIIAQLQKNNYSSLIKLQSTTLSTLSKNIYIYQLQVEAKKMCDIIQEIIITRFSDIDNVDIQELIHVLKDYTVTRNGSRDIYKFLEKIVHNKLADITLQRHYIQKFITIYEQSNLCSQQTLQLLRAFIL